MKVIKYKRDSVLIQDGNIKTWIDIWIDNEDVISDWNQNDFIMTDSNEVVLKNWQDNLEHSEKATGLALEILEKTGLFYQDENAKWHHTEKYHKTKGTTAIK